MAFDPLSAAFEIGSKIIDRVWPNTVEQASAQAKLIELRQSGELAKMVNETKQFEIAVADLNSAREREVKVATGENAPYVNKVITPYLALIIMCGVFGGMFLLTRIADDSFSQAQEHIVIYILGALTAMGTQVISYYFGSSRGDAAKDQALRDLLKKE